MGVALLFNRKQFHWHLVLTYGILFVIVVLPLQRGKEFERKDA